MTRMTSIHSNHERLAIIENSIRISLPNRKRNIFSLSESEKANLIIENAPEVLPILKIFEILTKWSFEKREYYIFKRKSAFLIHKDEPTFKEIGEILGLSGERVRQLLKKSEKSIKTRLKKYINQNPEILQTSIYHKKNWSKIIILNNHVVDNLNEIEKANYSIKFVEYFFSTYFMEHIMINQHYNLKSVYFINRKLFNEYKSIKSFFRTYQDPSKRAFFLNNSNSTLKTLFETVINEEDSN